MKGRTHLGIFILLSVYFISCTDKKDRVNYYFDAVNGNNKNSGTSPEKPFKSLRIIKDLLLKPGDSILLKSGVIFNDYLYISCKGSDGKPIVLGKYGGKA